MSVLRQWYRIVVNKSKKKDDEDDEDEDAKPYPEKESDAADPEEDPEEEDDDEEEKPAPSEEKDPEKDPKKDPDEDDEDDEEDVEASADIFVFDEIGRSYFNDNAVTAKQFIDDINGLPPQVKTLRLHINSPGGDVAEALAIANTLRAQRQEKGRTVDVSIEGVAASAATIISSAGQPIRIADNAMMMIHDPWAITLGNSAEMRKTAEVLDRLRDSIVATYRWVSKLTPKKLAGLMSAETWMNAQEAVDNGLATTITKSVKAAASFRPDVMNSLRVPDRFKAQFEAFLRKPSEPPTPPAPARAASAAEVLRLCREADCLDHAEAILDSKATISQARERVATVRDLRARAAAREREVRAVCSTARLEDLANGYVASGMDVAAVKAQLAVITGKLDKAEIDAGIRPDRETKGKPAIDVTAIYAERNKQRSQNKE